MTLFLICFIVGAILFAMTVVYYLVDYRRTGVLYRKKLPWMVIGGAGGLLAVGAVFTASAGGGF